MHFVAVLRRRRLLSKEVDYALPSGRANVSTIFFDKIYGWHFVDCPHLGSQRARVWIHEPSVKCSRTWIRHLVAAAPRPSLCSVRLIVTQPSVLKRAVSSPSARLRVRAVSSPHCIATGDALRHCLATLHLHGQYARSMWVSTLRHLR